MSSRRWALAIVAAAALGLGAGDARAYCRATTCEADGVRCDPPTGIDCGEPLRWRRRTIGVSVHQEGSVHVSRKVAREALLAAFATWVTADCGGTSPSIRIEDLGYVACDQTEYNSTAGNANLLVFRDKKWAHASGPHNIALTTVTFDSDTGEIFDGDIEVNSSDFPLTVTDTTTDYDLASVLTHEVGHFFGLAHSESTDSSMYAVYTAGDTDFRSLAPDDTNAICTVYPPADDNGDDNPLPRHGFASECAAAQTEGDCAARAPGSGEGSAAAIAAAGLAAVAARRRLRSRRASLSR